MKIIQPIVGHIRSPITARAMLAFLMLGLFVLVVVFHYIEERSAERRHRETQENYKKTEIGQEELRQQKAIIDKSLTQLALQAETDRETKQAIQEVANALRQERQESSRRQAAVIRAVKRGKPPCYELRRRVTKIGAAEVVTVDLVPKPKCP